MARDRRAGRPTPEPDSPNDSSSSSDTLLWFEVADAVLLAAYRAECAAPPADGPADELLPQAPTIPDELSAATSGEPRPPVETADAVSLAGLPAEPSATRCFGTPTSSVPPAPAPGVPWNGEPTTQGHERRGASIPPSASHANPWRTLPFPLRDADLGQADAPPAIIDGIPTQVPPLLDKRLFSRAFRVFKRTVPTPYGKPLLDEDATAERAAQDRLWLPLCVPPQERWLDLDVVMDNSPSAALLRNQFDELVDAIRTVCAFRRIHAYLLDTASRDLVLRPTTPLGPARALPDLALRGDPRRQLVMVLSDGVGQGWHDGRVSRLLAVLATVVPTGIVNPLPIRQWRRTGLAPVPARLASTGAVTPNRRLDVLATWRPEGSVVPVPVVALDADSLARWGRFVTGEARDLEGAVTWCPFASDTGRERPTEPPRPAHPDVSPAELVSRFRATASTEAYQLAVHLAALPLSVPVIQMVQAATLPTSRPSDLSEVLGSGLIRRVAADAEPGTVAVTHDFVGGVREALLATGRRSQTAWVMISLLDRLEGAAGILSPLRRMLITPRTAPLPALAAADAPFLTPFMTAMRALGSPYHEPAQKLRRALRHASLPDASPSITQGSEAVPNSVPSDEVTMQPSADVVSPVAPLPTSEEAVEDASELPPIASPIELLAPGVSVSIRSLPPAADRDPSEPPPVWGNVPPRNIQFTGREELLEELHHMLSEGMTAVLPHALHGMGGVGKSQLAIEYVYRHTRDYDLIWWVPAEGDGQIRQSLVELAAELGLPVGREANVAVPAVLEALRVGRPFRNWLLIFDNAEDMAKVREFFPAGGQGKILVTSRNSAWTNVAQTVEVNVFKREESIKLLRVRDPDLNDSAAGRLADALGDLPLAIEQAAAWLAETAMTVNEYLALLQEKTNEILAQQTSSTDYAVPVAAAWNVSLERLQESNLPALRLLQVCAFFAPEPVSLRILSGTRNLDGPDELVDALSDPIKLGQSIRAIKQYALAKISHRHRTILLHRLVQSVLRGRLDEDEAGQYRHCAHQLLANADPEDPDSTEHWPTYAQLLPHIRHAELVGCTDKWARRLFLNTIDFLYRWGDYAGSLELAESAITSWTELMGADDDQKLEAQQKVSRSLRGLGRHQEAYESDQNARDILVAKYGEEHELSLAASGNVCVGLRMLGDFRAALEADRQLYETSRRRFGPDDPVTLMHAYYYGISLRLMDQVTEAEERDRDTHARRARVLGEDHLSTLSVLAGIGFDVMDSGRYIEAREILRQLTQRMRTQYGDDHPGTIGNISNLSVAERKAGDHDTALMLSTEALERGRARYGQDNPETASAALNHAINLRQTGDLPQSIVVGEQAAARYERIYGPRHPSTAAAKANIAVSLRRSGRTEEALRLNAEALSVLVNRLGEDHSWSVIAAINHASVVSALGDPEHATELGRAALEHARRVDGEDHPTTLAVMLNLSLDLRKLGGDAEAEAETLLADAQVRYRRSLGDAHPATIAADQAMRADCDLYSMPL